MSEDREMGKVFARLPLDLAIKYAFLFRFHMHQNIVPSPGIRCNNKSRFTKEKLSFRSDKVMKKIVTMGKIREWTDRGRLSENVMDNPTRHVSSVRSSK